MMSVVVVDGVMKRILMIFYMFLILLSYPSVPCLAAGRGFHLMNNNYQHMKNDQGVFPYSFENTELVRERVLMRANTKDYGSYDPTPALSKPRFKLIPN
ncbi:hypothetical protein LINPERPRIM_LOCUS31593 [Linum perenne]